MGRIITFYSYKGGTGRSMALANVAWVLASNGKSVLTIDWDLEAPGLHRYFHPFLNDKEISGQESEGVIDMMVDFAVRAATPAQEGEKQQADWYEKLADFSKWRKRLHWPSGEIVRLGRYGAGRIDFVPAGRQGSDYASRVNLFNWQNFYTKLDGGAFLDAARRNLSAYDYVLIDSRTGVSDTSGICTVQMPDTMVLCFTLNFQNIKGAASVAKSVREQRPDMRIFPVPMRIDPSEKDLLDQMKNYASDQFTRFLDSQIDASKYWFSMEVKYIANYAYAEKLAVFEQQTSDTASTLPAMERLTAYLTDDEIKQAMPLPESDRAAALKEFKSVLIRVTEHQVSAPITDVSETQTFDARKSEGAGGGFFSPSYGSGAAYIPGCQYDLYISYAAENNRDGWVEQFEKALGEELGELIGSQFSPRSSIFFDRRGFDRSITRVSISSIETLNACRLSAKTGKLLSQRGRRPGPRN